MVSPSCPPRAPRGSSRRIGEGTPGRFQAHASVDQGEPRVGAAAQAGLQGRHQIALGRQSDCRGCGGRAVAGYDVERSFRGQPSKRISQYRGEGARRPEHQGSQARCGNGDRHHRQGGRDRRLRPVARALEQCGGCDPGDRAQEREDHVAMVSPFPLRQAERGEDQRAGVEQGPDGPVPARLPQAPR